MEPTDLLVEEHGKDIIKLLLWALGVGGVIFLGLLKWIANVAVSQIRTELHGIKEAIDGLTRTSTSLQMEITSLKTELAETKSRLSTVETTCRFKHSIGQD